MPASAARARALELLNPDERARFERFIPDPPRFQFLAGRVLLRAILGRELGVDPREVAFVEGERGKLALAGESSGGLQFNLSHTDGLVAAVFARGAEVGVDVERIDPARSGREIARRHFAPSEVAALDALQGDRFAREFFRVWTLKESYIKARGLGLAIPLREFAFSPVPEEADAEIRIAFTRAIDDDAARWQFAFFKPTAEHRLAVAVRPADGVRRRVRWERFQADTD
jgi:4'-phosphopantetheinyl transferase